MFWVAPILGAAIGALIHRYFVGDREDVIVPTIAGEPAAR
jgi:aquaporin Z